MNKDNYPEPVVGICIVNKDKKLLLVRSHKWHNMWLIPGGHIELEETIDQAIKREAKEETNLTVTNPEFICLWEYLNDGQYHDKRHMIFLNYRVDTGETDVALNDEGQEYVWATEDEALKLKLNKYTRLTVEQFSDKIFK